MTHRHPTGFQLRTGQDPSLSARMVSYIESGSCSFAHYKLIETKWDGELFNETRETYLALLQSVRKDLPVHTLWDQLPFDLRSNDEEILFGLCANDSDSRFANEERELEMARVLESAEYIRKNDGSNELIGMRLLAQSMNVNGVLTSDEYASILTITGK